MEAVKLAEQCLWKNEHMALACCHGPDWIIDDGNLGLAVFLGVTKKDMSGVSLLWLLKDAGLHGMERMFQHAEEKIPFVFQAQDTLWVVSWQYLSGADTDDPDLHRKLVSIQEVPFCQTTSKSSCSWDELEALFDAIHDGIWVIDSEGITQRVNKAMLRMAGLDERDLIGRHVSAPVLQGMYSACVTLRALEEKKRITMFDDYANGKRFLNTSTPILDDTGNVWRVIACIRDMSVLEEMQNRLNELESTNANYKDRIQELEQVRLSDFIGTSPALRRLLLDISRAARVDAVSLILGETGVGKTMAASAIHKASLRRDAPFISVNCGAIPATLIESELFGYESGAFTGANKSGKKGLFEAAGSGTIFLDEIAELPLSMQVKLLHVLDERKYTRVGGVKQQQLEARILAATNKSLEDMVAEGTFREDLFYRLNVLNVRIPSLRERDGDIPMLAKHFLTMANESNGMHKRITQEVLQCFSRYGWPGNVRELRATVEYLVAMTERDNINVEDLPKRFREHVKEQDQYQVTNMKLKEAMDNLERRLISKALVETGSTWKAAKQLGISQSSVVRKAQKHKIGVTEIVHG